MTVEDEEAEDGGEEGEEAKQSETMSYSYIHPWQHHRSMYDWCTPSSAG